jgi:hypothetical protein
MHGFIRQVKRQRRLLFDQLTVGEIQFRMRSELTLRFKATRDV